MKKIVFIIVILTICYSCEKVINIDFPDNGRKIVLNSIFNTDSTLVVKLSRSEHILTTTHNFEPITNATVSLFENDMLVETRTQNYKGAYVFNTVIIGSKTYSIEASSVDFGTVSCKSMAPLPINIDSIKMTPVFVDEGNGLRFKQMDFDLTFKDNPDEQNYYMLTGIYKQRTGYLNNGGKDTIYFEGMIPLDLKTIIHYTYQNNMIDNSSSLLFDDATFNGELYQFHFFAENFWINRAYTQNPKTTIYFYLTSFSKDLYQYNLSSNKYQEVHDDPLAEPVKVYSNIKNGYGIFAGSSISADSISFMFDDVFGKHK